MKDEPAYQQIAAEWAEAIDNGALSDGQQLPTRPELEQRYGVSRQVVRDALALLHHEGYLRSRSAKGTFVHRLARLTLPMYVLEADDRALDAFVACVQEQNHTARQEIRVETAAAELHIAELLHLDTGERVTIRRRIRYVDEQPYALADSYFPHHLVANSRIADPADIPTGGRHVLADLGLAMTRHHDTIIARRPHRRETADLNLTPGLAVLSHTRMSYTTTGQPIRLLVQILPSDRWQLTYDVQS